MQDGAKFIDPADFAGSVVPGALLVLALFWMFYGSSGIQSFKDLSIGGLGVLLLLSLVAGQCLSAFAKVIFYITRLSPRGVFFRAPYSRMTQIQRSEFRLGTYSTEKRGSLSLFIIRSMGSSRSVRRSRTWNGLTGSSPCFPD